MKSFIYSILLIIFSALLVSSAFFTLSYPNIPFGWMMPFSLTPLFVGTHRLTFLSQNKNAKTLVKKAVLCLWFFGYIVQLISFFWITKPIIYFGAVPPIASYALFAFICIFSSFFFPLIFSPFIFSLWYQNKFPGKKLFVLPLALSITLIEIYLPRFFHWSFGGLLSSNTYFNQLESLFGFNTGSLFIFYISLSLSNLSRNRKMNIQIGMTCSIVIFSVLLFGILRVHHLGRVLQNETKFRVGFVQPNFTFNSLASVPLPSQDSQVRSFSRMLEMSQEVIGKSIKFHGKKLDLLVWPESTAPDYFLFTPWQISRVKDLSLQTQVPFLIQTIEMKQKDIDKFGFKNAPIWSSSVIVNSNGLQPNFFQKWIPMPFGEEFPFESQFPIIGKWYRSLFTNASKVERSTNYMSLPIRDDIFVTPLICFDTIDQNLSYLSTKYGKASFFVNQANFVWMVDSNAGLELSLLDQMRAIENGRSVVVASNTGPSLAFDPLGRLILPPTKLLTQASNFVDIPLYKGTTLFQIVSKWPLVILGILSICYLIFITRKSFLNANELSSK